MKSKIDSKKKKIKIVSYGEGTIKYQVAVIIIASVNNVFPKSDLELKDIFLEHPTLENYGDYYTNLALILAGKLKMKPRDIAEKIYQHLNINIKQHQSVTSQTDSNASNNNKIPSHFILEKVEVAGPGFINIWLSKEYLITSLRSVLITKNAFVTTQMVGRRIAVEYTDPNPFKEFHIGHMYSNFIGEAISRLLESAGAIVWRGDFYGDVGMHIAKSLYGFLVKLKIKSEKLKTLQGEAYIKELKLEVNKLEKLTISQRQKFLGEGYAIGVRKFEEDKKVVEEVKDINYLIYIAAQDLLKKNKNWKPIINYRQYVKFDETKLKEIEIVYEAGLRWSLEYFESIYKILGTRFDGYYPESWVGEYGMQMVEKGLTSGVLENSEGTVIYRGEKDGLHTRVFVNKLGLPTYEAKDLGLAQAKYQDFKYDLSLNIFGKEIDEYYKVVKKAMERIEPDLGLKARHLAHGMVKLPEGKMSSRTGNVVTFEWLLKESQKQALLIMEKNDLPANEKLAVAEKVGLGAIRFALLKSSPGNDIVFDFEKSITFEGDSGPYLQYTYARCRSVLRKSKVKSEKSKVDDQLSIINYQYNQEEFAVLRTIYKFPEVVLEGAKTFSPNILAVFLLELAGKYNIFYNKHSILGIDNKQQITDNKTTLFRLLLTEATSVILQKGLNILGIETVERM